MQPSIQALLKEDIDRHTAMLERRVQERTQELEATNKELTSANRDLEDFTASAAHDLRAPLNAMAGNCGLLRELLGEASSFTRSVNLLGENADGERLVSAYDHANAGDCFFSIRKLLSQVLDEITAP